MTVQTILKTIHFLPFIIHPPIHHLPWSPVHAGAPVLESDTCFEAQEVVVMLQRGGQPFSGYHNCCHGRRPEDQLPAYLQKSLLHKLAVLDAGMHICGNFSADQVFLTSVWVENECLDWEATKELSALLEIPFPAIMFEGVYDKDLIINAFEASTDSAKTGYDIRLKKGFRVFDMGKSVGRFVA